MAAGVTQPGGAGTTIYVYDDASSASGTGYTFAEIAAAFPADFVSNGTNKPSYRAKVTLQVGDVGSGSATTTLVDTAESTVIWDNTKTLAYRSTQVTSWFTNLGTKIGTGSSATGNKGTTLYFGATTTLRGTANLYGCKIGNGALTNVVYLAGEIINCLFQASHATSTNGFLLLPPGVDVLYNVDFTAATTGDVVQSLTADSVNRLTVGGGSIRGAIQLPSAAVVVVKDTVFFGSPTRADILWQASTVVVHKLVRPVWTNNAPKFGFVGASGTPLLSGATQEMWLYDVKVVDGTGAGISGIPVRLTDSVGSAQVDTTTDSAGEISFGSDLTLNAVNVMDHYGTSGYAQRYRGPFLCEINQPSMTGYNSNYNGRRYYFQWPGYESVGLSSGTFQDVNDIVNLQEPSGGATNWTECVLP